MEAAGNLDSLVALLEAVAADLECLVALAADPDSLEAFAADLDEEIQGAAARAVLLESRMVSQGVATREAVRSTPPGAASIPA